MHGVIRFSTIVAHDSRGPDFHGRQFANQHIRMIGINTSTTVACMQGMNCSVEDVQRACATQEGDSPLFRQFLYSVYAHPAPGYSACVRQRPA